MTILNVSTESVGQAGILPKIIYICTNDSTSEVTTAGYLNKTVASGTELTPLAMALVSVSNSPYVKFYNISFSGGNWSLVAL